MSAEEDRTPRMEAESVRRARRKLGLTLWQFATLLGYEGAQRRQMGHDLETERRPVREPQRRLIEAYLAGYRPPDWPEEVK